MSAQEGFANAAKLMNLEDVLKTLEEANFSQASKERQENLKILLGRALHEHPKIFLMSRDRSNGFDGEMPSPFDVVQERMAQIFDPSKNGLPIWIVQFLAKMGNDNVCETLADWVEYIEVSDVGSQVVTFLASHDDFEVTQSLADRIIFNSAMIERYPEAVRALASHENSDVPVYLFDELINREAASFILHHCPDVIKIFAEHKVEAVKKAFIKSKFLESATNPCVIDSLVTLVEDSTVKKDGAAALNASVLSAQPQILKTLLNDSECQKVLQGRAKCGDNELDALLKKIQQAATNHVHEVLGLGGGPSLP